MTSCHFKLAEEYISVAKVTVGPPLSRLIPKLFSDKQPLPNRTNSRVQITDIIGFTGKTEVIKSGHRLQSLGQTK